MSSDDATPAPAGSRERLLAAAVELILEHHRSDAGIRAAFKYLTPSAVAGRARLSRGLIYHHWGDTERAAGGAFERFLADVTDSLWGGVLPRSGYKELVDALPDNLSDIILVLTALEADRLEGPLNANVRAALALTLYGVVSEDQLEVTVGRLAALFEAIFVKVGREPVPPLGYEDIVFAVSALADGLALHQLVAPHRLQRRYEWSPEVPPTDESERWSLFAIATEAIALRMTRPVNGDASRNASDEKGQVGEVRRAGDPPRPMGRRQ